MSEDKEGKPESPANVTTHARSIGILAIVAFTAYSFIKDFADFSEATSSFVANWKFHITAIGSLLINPLNSTVDVEWIRPAALLVVVFMINAAAGSFVNIKSGITHRERIANRAVNLSIITVTALLVLRYPPWPEMQFSQQTVWFALWSVHCVACLIRRATANDENLSRFSFAPVQAAASIHDTTADWLAFAVNVGFTALLTLFFVDWSDPNPAMFGLSFLCAYALQGAGTRNVGLSAINLWLARVLVLGAAVIVLNLAYVYWIQPLERAAALLKAAGG